MKDDKGENNLMHHIHQFLSKVFKEPILVLEATHEKSIVLLIQEYTTLRLYEETKRWLSIEQTKNLLLSLCLS